MLEFMQQIMQAELPFTFSAISGELSVDCP